MIDVSEVVLDPDLCSSFSIERSTGDWGPGGWVVTNVEIIDTYGAVRNISGRDIKQLPEGDQINDNISFRSITEMFVTDAEGKQTSDILIYRGEKYRVISTKDYAEQGYFYAMAARISGK